MAAPPESRLKNSTPVRYGVAATMDSRRRISAAIKRKTQKPSKWAQKLSARYKHAFAQEASKKLDAAGTMSNLSNTIVPAATGAKAIKKKLQKSRKEASRKIRSGAGAGPGQPETKITYQLITDHPFLSAPVRIISPASPPPAPRQDSHW